MRHTTIVKIYGMINEQQFKMLFVMKISNFLIYFIVAFSSLHAQKIDVIDHKGTKNIVNNNSVTKSSTAPSAALEGDIWFDTTTNISKVWNDGVSTWEVIDVDQVTTSATAPATPVLGDVWMESNTLISKIWDGSAWKQLNTWLGYKTIHHATNSVLALTAEFHNNSDIHIESTGNLAITNTAVNDGTNFYITNTTAVNRSLSFTGFAGAYLRNGGAIADIKTTGLTLKANTRYLAHVTKNGVNYYFNATEAGGSGNVVPLWKSNTDGGDYDMNDLVNYNGQLFKNLLGNNNDTTPNNDNINWSFTDAYLGKQTIHHNATSTLAITHADHNNADIHIENTGELSITNTAVNDGTNFYITNTTAINRSLSFTGFAGAYLRNGGAIADIKATGLTLKANTRYLTHVTKNGVNYYFNATEAAGAATAPYEVFKENQDNETITNLVDVDPTNATFTLALPDGNVNATATTTSSFSGSFSLDHAFNGNDHATAGQNTETVTIIFDRLFVLTKLRGKGRPSNTEYFTDFELKLYDENDALISTTTTSISTGEDYFEFTNDKKIKKLVLVGSNKVGTNPGIGFFEFFTAEKQIDYAVIPVSSGIVKKADVVSLNSDEGINRIAISDPTISKVILPNFETFDSTRFDLHNVTANSSAGGSETLFDGEYNVGTAAFEATSTTTTDDYGIGYRFKSYYNVKEFKIQASSTFLRSGGGTVRVYDNGVWVYGSNVITAASASEGWVSITVPANIKGDEVRFIYENGAVNTANDRVINISEFQILGSYPETLSVNGGLSVNGNLRVGSRLIFTNLSNSRVGINTANPSRTLDVSGDIGYSGSIVNTSDRRLKERINPLEKSLEKLLAVRGVNFYWKDKSISDKEQIGVIAQEIEKIFPNLVVNGKDYKSVHYVALIPVLIESIKEQQAQLKAQERELNTLKVRVNQIEQTLKM